MNDKITIDGVVYVKQQEPDTQVQEEPWTPPEGEWYVKACGKIGCFEPDPDTSNYGNEFETEQAAAEQAVLNKGWQWLCHLARELNPSGRCMKPMEKGYRVYFQDAVKAGFSWAGGFFGTANVFETQKAAEEAIEIMNRDFDRWKEIVG